MTTRSGRSFKPVMDSSLPRTGIPTEDDPANPIPSTANDENPTPQAEDAAPPTTMTATRDLMMILDVMCTMMVDRERREKEIAEEI